MFWNWVRAFFNGIIRAVQAIFEWLFDFAVSCLSSMVDWLPEIDLPITDDQVVTIYAELSKWNHFVPIVEGFTLLLLFMIFCLAFAAIRIIVSLIPTVG